MAKEGIAEEGIVFAQGGSDGHGTPLSSGGCVSVAMLRLLLKAIG